MLKFRAKIGTADGRIIQGKIYQGTIIGDDFYSLRVCVYDERNEWMTFKPICFEPVREDERTEKEKEYYRA